MRIIFSMFFSMFFLYCLGQSAREDIYEDIECSASNCMKYKYLSTLKAEVPKGYKPFYLSAYLRHGSRFLINKESYEYPLKVFQRAAKYNKLTNLGVHVVGVLDSISKLAYQHYGELTNIGVAQHVSIAQRMYDNYPEIFSKSSLICAVSTDVPRCILSMNASCNQLVRRNPRLAITCTASVKDLYYMNNKDTLLSNRYIRRSVNLVHTLDSLRLDLVHSDRLIHSLINDEKYIKDSIDADRLMLALFSLAGSLQNIDTHFNLYSIFTKEECYDLWRLDNCEWYIYYGTSPLSGGMMPYQQVNLLENIIETANDYINKGQVGATLRYGHEVCVLPLACLLELDNCGLKTNDLSDLETKWKNYKIFPMAANIQFVFYKNNKGKILVKVLLNEVESSLPIRCAYKHFYNWKDVEEYYCNKIKLYRKKIVS